MFSFACTDGLMGKNPFNRKESERELALVEAKLMRKRRQQEYEEEEKQEAAEKAREEAYVPAPLVNKSEAGATPKQHSR